MCGFAGFIDLARDAADGVLRARVKEMSDRLYHRGPNDSGEWVDQDAGVALGFRRLSIIDLSSAGHQPMLSASGRFVLTFNGEIYNHAELRDAIGPAPYRGHSDTEVMLHAFERWGVADSVRRFVGMFGFALWDRQERTLHLGRDRFGEKPLFYGWMGRTLLFGSELKALRAHPAFRGDIRRDVLVPYLRHGWVPGPCSIYRGVYKLPQATTLTIRFPGTGAGDPDCAGADGTTGSAGWLPEPAEYWSAARAAERGEAQPFAGDEESAADALEKLLGEAVAGQMVADVPVGAFLSGGVDSSLLVSLMQKQCKQPVRTFSIGFDEAGFDEAPYAKAIAQHLGTQHTERYVTPADCLAVVPRIPQLNDEPFGDPSQIPTYLVSELASRDVTVSLTGDGGDELFGGYNWYRQAQSIWGNVGWMPRPMCAGLGRAMAGVSPQAWDRVLGAAGAVLPTLKRRKVTGDKLHKVADLLGHADGPVEVFRHLRSRWNGSWPVVLGADEPLTLLNDRGRWPEVREAVHLMMFLDAVTFLPDNHTVKMDRASMAFSLETRSPFLDHRVAEFGCRLPMSLKVRPNTGKYLLKKVLARHVPRNLTERPKIGFTVPIERWLRRDLRDWAEGLLAEDRLRREGYFDAALVRRQWAEHQSGRSWQFHLWYLLMFQSWLDEQAKAVTPAPPAVCAA